MKRTRWTSWLYSRGFPLLLSILLLEGGGGLSFAASAQAVRSAGYDGETVFRGLLFGSGPVAGLFPEIWDNPQIAEALRSQSAAQAQEAAEMQNRLVAWIRGQDGTFFDRFGVALQSGDHLRIEQAVEEASELTSEALSAELGVAPEELTRLPEGLAQQVAVAFAVSFALIAVAVRAAIGVIFISVFITPGAASEASGLQREMWIDLIATRLGSH